MTKPTDLERARPRIDRFTVWGGGYLVGAAVFYSGPARWIALAGGVLITGSAIFDLLRTRSTS